MCGRTALYLDPEDIRRNVNVENWQGEERYRKSYNVCPTRYQPAMLQPSDPNLPPHLVSMKWGLVPAWKKNVPGSGQVLVNARDDSLLGNKPMFNGLKQRKRCAVLAQGYFEWLRKGNDKKPHFVKRSDGNLMIFAALYDEAKIDGEPTLTYTIITTTAPSKLAFLHDRMPVRLDTDPKALKIWLDPRKGWTQEVANTLRSIDDGVEVYPVSPAVGKVGNDTPLLVEPLNVQSAQRSLFFPNAKISVEKQEDEIPTQSDKDEKRNISPKVEASSTETGSDIMQVPIDKFCESEARVSLRHGVKRKAGPMDHAKRKINEARDNKDLCAEKLGQITAGGDDKLGKSKKHQKFKTSADQKSKKRKTEDAKITSYFKRPPP